MMTGATLLWQRLKSPRVVKSIKLGEDFTIFKTLPKFLYDLQSLDELLIYSRTDEWSRLLGLIIKSVPSGVRKLELSGNWELNILSGSLLADCPQIITSLSIIGWDGSVRLPSSLIHFEAAYVKLSASSFVSELPPSLESFVALNELRGLDLIAPLLPPSVRKVDFGIFSTERGSWYRLLEQFPKFLTNFAVLRGVIMDNPESVLLLSPTLTELDIHGPFPSSVWHLLPPNLATLSFGTAENYPRVTMVDTVGRECEVDSIPFDLLPRSLTSLEVRNCSGAWFCGPPITSHQSYFPPNLTSLKIPPAPHHLHHDVVKLLPSTLTYLEIINLCEQVCEHLPTGLKTLKSHKTLMSPNLIKFLPKSLTSLRLAFCNPSDTWYDNNTGEKVDPVSKLPEYSIHEKCLSNNFDWKLSSPLPSTLMYLEVSRPNELGDLFAQSQKLPNLLEFRFGGSKCFTDISIPLLSHHLQTLQIPSSSMVSGSSFKFLPRCLIELDLASSQSVVDSDIQHLPRTLKRLNLQHAKHLSDLCVGDLPPHLEKLEMRYNRNISAASYPSFPYSLRSPTVCNAASFNNWSISYGKICSGYWKKRHVPKNSL